MVLVALTPSELSPELGQICARAAEFSLPALIEQLMQAGIDGEAIHFASVPALGPATRVVQGVQLYRSTFEFHDENSHCEPIYCEIQVQSGLFAGDSPLADYLRQLAQTFPEGAGLAQLIRLLDDALHHQALRRTPYSLGTMDLTWPPAAAEIGLRDLAPMQARWSMDWLFRAVFPELAVHTSEACMAHARQAASAQLGGSALGHSGLGALLDQRGWGFRIHLVAFEPMTPSGEWWPECASERLKNLIFPRLAKQRSRLDVEITVHGQANVLTLAPSAALGYSPLGQAKRALFKRMLFSGIVGVAPGETMPQALPQAA